MRVCLPAIRTDPQTIEAARFIGGLQKARAQEFSRLFFHFGTQAVVAARLGTPRFLMNGSH
jgi:hypothetical protein